MAENEPEKVVAEVGVAQNEHDETEIETDGDEYKRVENEHKKYSDSLVEA